MLHFRNDNNGSTVFSSFFLNLRYIYNDHIFFLCVCVWHSLHKVFFFARLLGALFFISIFGFFFGSFSLIVYVWIFFSLCWYTVSIPTMITKLEMKTNKLKFICVWFVLYFRIVIIIFVASSQYVANVSTDGSAGNHKSKNCLLTLKEAVKWDDILLKWSEHACVRACS